MIFLNHSDFNFIKYKRNEHILESFKRIFYRYKFHIKSTLGEDKI